MGRDSPPAFGLGITYLLHDPRTAADQASGACNFARPPAPRFSNPLRIFTGRSDDRQASEIIHPRLMGRRSQDKTRRGVCLSNLEGRGIHQMDTALIALVKESTSSIIKIPRSAHVPRSLGFPPA